MKIRRIDAPGILLFGAVIFSIFGIDETFALTSCTDLAESTAAKRYCEAKAGELVNVRIGDLRPTQSSLGFDELYYRLGRIEFGKDQINKKFDDWCESNGQVGAKSASPNASLRDPSSFSCKGAVGAETEKAVEPMKTAVIGPRGHIYLTDGHHTFTSFFELPDGGPDLHVRVRITSNLSNLEEPAFWSEMEKRGWVWLRDADDLPITADKLPTSLGMTAFRNDQFRSILYFGRDIGYKQNSSNATFQEFYWGRWLRTQSKIDLRNYNLNQLSDYVSLVKDVTNAQSALNDADQVSDGKSAGHLGRIPWNAGASENDGEFAKIAAPFSENKPGKLAYSLRYKEAHPK